MEIETHTTVTDPSGTVGERPVPQAVKRRIRRVTTAMQQKQLDPLLLTPEECAAVLGIGANTWYAYWTQIAAVHGLTPVVCGRVRKFSYQQLREIVARCVKTQQPLFTKESLPTMDFRRGNLV